METEAGELQQAYDTARGAAQTVAITQQLAKIKEAQVLKAQVDAVRQHEVVLKEHIQPWLDETFSVSTTIEGNLAHMKVVYDTEQATASDREH